MAPCPLCATEMDGDECPRCAGARAGAGKAADARVPQPLPPGAAPAPSVPLEREPLPVETVEPEEHGCLPAAAIFAAQGLASVFAAGDGAPWEIGSALVNLATAALLLRQAGWAKWLVVMGAALGVVQGVALFVLSGHWLAMAITLPSACVLGAFWSEGPRWRLGFAAAGVLLAFSWYGLVGSVTGADGSDPLAPYAVEGGAFSDPVAGLTVQAPPEMALVDLQKVRADRGAGRKGGVQGLFGEEGGALDGAGDRVLARAPKDDVVAVVGVGSLPPQVPTESLLARLVGPGARVDQADELVPRPLRLSGLAAGAWRDPTRQVLVLRAPDGRIATVVCTVNQRASERLCGALFGGVSLSLGKRPGWEQQQPGSPPPRP